MAQWDPREFQAAIRDLLDRRGWSQNELALQTGISQAAINRWMQPLDSYSAARLTQPTPETLQKLAPVMGRSHTDLMRLAGHLPADPEPRQRDQALETLIAHIEAAWPQMDPNHREARVEATSALWNVHRNRPRRNRSTPRQEQQEHKDEGEQSRDALLTAA